MLTIVMGVGHNDRQDKRKGTLNSKIIKAVINYKPLKRQKFMSYQQQIDTYINN